MHCDLFSTIPSMNHLLQEGLGPIEGKIIICRLRAAAEGTAVSARARPYRGLGSCNTLPSRSRCAPSRLVGGLWLDQGPMGKSKDGDYLQGAQDCRWTEIG